MKEHEVSTVCFVYCWNSYLFASTKNTNLFSSVLTDKLIIRLSSCSYFAPYFFKQLVGVRMSISADKAMSRFLTLSSIQIEH